MFLQNFITQSYEKSFNYDHMIYLRIFEGCNLFCEHCFIPSNPKKMDIEQFNNKNITNTLINEAHISPGSNLYIQWHGGEPTLLGLDFLKNALEQVIADDRFNYQHGIQTNLMNFDKNPDQWADFYKKYFNSQLGVSWDFGIRHVKINSLTDTETNVLFDEHFWNNIKLAQEHNLDLYMVITATKLFFQHFKNPLDFFNFIAEKGITKINFERITKNGFARQSWDKLGLTNLEYSTYMSKFYKAYILFKENNPEIQLNISPFDGLITSVASLFTTPITSHKADVWDVLSYKNQGYGCWSGECDTKFHTIDSNGYKHGCTALTSEFDNKNKQLNTELLNDKKKIFWINKPEQTHKENILQTRQTRQESCQGCKFLSICSSGCLSIEKFDESHECSGAKKLFETIYQSISHLDIK